MDEYISRGDALDIASQYCPDDDGSCSKADVDPREMLDEIDALPAADVQPVDRWISVDDKLPDSDTTVLVWYTADSLFGRFGDYGVTHYRESSGWSKASLIGDDQAIFYWMPLPEPPKEGDADA